jgi:hypothetical protein
MSMNRVDDRWLLPVEGLVSGILTCLISVLPFSIGNALFLFVGLVFGVVISVHFWFFRGVRSAFRLLTFTATCTVAYIVSFFATAWSPFHPQFLNFSGIDSRAIDSSPFLTGGFLGAAIVCAGIYFFLAPSKNWQVFLLKAAFISVACGLLGVLGWAVGNQLLIGGWLSGLGSSLQYYALYVIWQTGAALLLGVLLPPLEAPVAAPDRVQPKIATLQTETRRTPLSETATIFLVLVVSTLAWFIVRQVQGERFGRRIRGAQQAAEQRLAAERPSPQYLPPIEDLAAERVLVLKPIAGHPCGRNYKSQVPSFNFIGYTAQYKRSETAGDGETTFADVDVRLYPNSDWAVYATKQGYNPSAEAYDPNTVKTVTKFGNKVIMNTVMRYPNGGGDLFFYWASGNRFVWVTFHFLEQDEFLEDYLALYPSSL